MLSPSSPARLSIAFDDDRLVAHAGLLLPATLAERLGLRELVDRHLDLGDAPGRANAGDKMATLVSSALAGGDCIDDADALRAGGTERVLGCTVKAPSTLGTFLRSFRWGHVRQLDRVSRALLARAWAAGAGPGEAPFTIDLDSTMCETYGLAKEGAQRPGYTGQRGYHPLLAVAAGTGDVLMARLRSGRAYSGRGAAHFLQETVGRVCGAGASGRLRNSGLFTERGERFAGMVVVPEVAGGRVRWLAGRAIDPERSPRFQSLPSPKPVLGMGRLGPAVGGRRRGGLRLACAGAVGPSRLRRPGDAGP